MDLTLSLRNVSLKSLATWLVIASALLWILYPLLLGAKLGLPVECFFMGQICVVLCLSPYLAGRAVQNVSGNISTDTRLTRTPVFSGKRLLKLLLISQLPIFLWVSLSTGAALLLTPIPSIKAFQMLATLAMYTLSAGAVGIAATRICKDALFGAECATLLWCLLIGGVFLLNPIKRYVDDLQPFIPPALHLNPLIVACSIFEDLDIFRRPALYERTPVPSYIFVYPNPWYLVGLWQLLLGGGCLWGTWQIDKFRKSSV